MTDLAQLLIDIANMVRRCPSVLAEIAGESNAIAPYLDFATTPNNSLTRAIYSQPKGTVLIAWQTSGIAEGEMEGWGHQIDFYVRALTGQSPLTLINAIIDGVPEGDTIRWRYLCVNDDVLPMTVEEVARLTDEEAIDYHVIRALFKEKGDYSNGVSS